MNAYSAWQEAPEAEFAVIGDPVSHSLSPRMHQAAYSAYGLSLRYVAIHVPAGEVALALDHLVTRGYRGVNVTVPHKEAALDWCADAAPLARRVRAANTIRFSDRTCINTDAPGFIDTLGDLGLRPGTALLLGAGGSARALAYALADEGWRLRIYNRTRARAEELLSGLRLNAEILDDPDPLDADLILNTTSASLQNADLGIPWERASAHAVAYDLMYAPTATPFMAAAAEHGLRTTDGRPLLAAQGARSFTWWLNLPSPRAAMLAALG